MNTKVQYKLLNDSDIQAGLRENIFSQVDIALIRDKSGRIVKHLPRTSVKNDPIPASLIQVNNTFIYQADVRPVIDAIVETRNAVLHMDTAEKYQTVIDSLEYYKNHKSRLNDLNGKALDALSAFEIRTDIYLDGLSAYNVGNIKKDELKVLLNSYVNIIFVYLISLHWMSHDVSSDTGSVRKIEKLESKVRLLFEQLLAKSDCDDIRMDRSIYAQLLLDNKFEVEEIERYIRHDRRFDSFSGFMQFVKRNHLVRNYDCDGYVESHRISLSAAFGNSEFNNAVDVVNVLFDVLERIDVLKNIRSELVDVGQVDFSQIEISVEGGGSSSSEPMGLLLPLHSGG